MRGGEGEILRVKKPTGPIPNKKLRAASKWKTYNGKFVTFKKDGQIYYVHFRYDFFKGVHDISVATSYTDDQNIIILDFYAGFLQRFVNQMDTLYAILFPRLYRKRHPELFSTKQ